MTEVSASPSEPRPRTWARTVLPWLVLLVLLAISPLVWLPASSGSALISGLVVGLALVIARDMYSRSAERRQQSAAINSALQALPNGAPTTDDAAAGQDEGPDAEIPRVAPREAGPSTTGR